MTDPPSRITTPAVLGILLGVLAVGGGASGLLRSSTRPLGADAGRAALARLLEVRGAPPLGFEVQAARRLTRGELYVTLAPPGGPPEDPPPLEFTGRVAKESKGGKHGEHGGGPRPRTEWEKLALREPGAAPLEAAFLFYEGSKRVGDRILAAQFARVHFKDIAYLRADGETVPVDSGHLDWGPYEVAWVQLRHFEKLDEVPTSHDTLRVNLSTGSQVRVLYLRWPRATPGSVDPARALLEVYRPRESD